MASRFTVRSDSGSRARQRSALLHHQFREHCALPSPSREADVELEQTFVQGALALAADARSQLEASSSVLAGPVSGSAGAVLSCTDTFGADYELLSTSCQPQVP